MHPKTRQIFAGEKWVFFVLACGLLFFCLHYYFKTTSFKMSALLPLADSLDTYDVFLQKERNFSFLSSVSRRVGIGCLVFFVIIIPVRWLIRGIRTKNHIPLP